MGYPLVIPYYNIIMLNKTITEKDKQYNMILQVFGLQAGLTAIDPERGMSPLQSILQPGCGVYYKRALLLPTYWYVLG